MGEVPLTERTRVRRKPERGVYDRVVIDAILDEALVCHVGIVVDGQPRVIPTAFGRDGDWLYLHGAASSQLLRTLAAGAPACVTVTLLDGLVLARSGFHHSMNYRSVVVYGIAEAVAEPEGKRAALDVVIDHLVPGRAAELRPPTDSELRATLVVRLPIDETSAKVRSGSAVDDAEDHELGVWAGVLPLALTAGAPVADALLDPGVAAAVPPYVRDWRR
jgi:uncharacterized protein